MGGKELWIKEEERVEEVLVDLLYECVSFDEYEVAYEEFEKLVDQFLKDGTIPTLDMRYPCPEDRIKTFDISSDQFDRVFASDWYKNRVEFLVEEHQAEYKELVWT